MPIIPDHSLADRLVARGRIPCVLSLAGSLPVVLAVTVWAAVPPVNLTLDSTSVREHQPAGTIVGILKAVDPDPDDSHTFTLVPGEGAEDNSRFTIVADTLRTAAVLNSTDQNRFRVRLHTQDSAGNGFEKQFTITVTSPSLVNGLLDYFAANPAVSNVSLATFDSETTDYFWVYQNCLAARGTIEMDVPANTPADTATSGTANVYLSATEVTRILAAKAAHAVWLDLNAKVPWRLRDYAPEHLRGLFARTNLFNPQSSSVFYFLSVVDHSPTVGYQYAVKHGLLKDTVFQTIQAVFNDCRSDFLHGSSSYGDPTCAYTLQRALTVYSTNRWRPARISRLGCHSMSRVLLGILRSVNIPGYETTTGEYFLAGHSEAVFPCVERVLPHGDHIYSASLTATPAEALMPTFQFMQDNRYTPPCAGSTYCVAMRYEALQGTAYPTPTILRGVRNPALYTYTNAVEFLTRYAGWNLGLTANELDQAATYLQTHFNETHRLTLDASPAQGSVINTPSGSDYATDSLVLLKALPEAGFVFEHWTGDVPSGQETANPLLIAMNVDKTVQATFTRPPVNVSIAQLPAGEVVIGFTALGEVGYTIEYRDDLDAGSWQTLTNVPVQTTTGVVTNTDPAQPIPVQRFYRIVTH